MEDTYWVHEMWKRVSAWKELHEDDQTRSLHAGWHHLIVYAMLLTRGVFGEPHEFVVGEVAMDCR